MSIASLSLLQRYKRLLQGMTLAVAIIYTSLVLYQSANGYPDIQLPSQHTISIDASSISNEIPQQHKMQHKLLQYQPITTTASSQQRQQQQPQQKRRKQQQQLPYISSQPSSSSSSSLAAAPPQQSPPPPPPPQQTTVIIRKDVYSFNFSDIKVSERPSAVQLHDIARRSRNGESLHAVTATPKPPITELDDIFISVKTTKNYHDTRLALIIKTWFQLARDQTWFFTDTKDPYYQEQTKGHLIYTNCSQGYSRTPLCCKMSAELDVFFESGKKWFCHFDDDNYVNVPRLIKLLNEYNPSMDWYLGKTSIKMPLEIHEDSKKSSTPPIIFWFGTGGAGICLSRALTTKMLPIAGGGKFTKICDKMSFPDDITMGFIIEHLLKVPLTVVDQFHSHLEPLDIIRPDSFHEQVSLSYRHTNVINIDGFDMKTDPKRFYSLHCQLFPYFSFCPPR